MTAVGMQSMFNSFELFRVSCTCLEACWTLHTPHADVLSGCSTSVSFTAVQHGLAASHTTVVVNSQAQQVKHVAACRSS